MLKANIKENINYKGADLEKLNKSLALLEDAINGEPFKLAVLNFKNFQFIKYKCWLKFKKKKIPLKYYSNAELYEVLLKGHRQIETDSFMDLKLRLSDTDGGSAIGATNSKDVTTTYRDAFDSMSEAQLAAHLTHEWTHTMGFSHSYRNSCDATRDCLSVPYAIGNIIEIILTGKCRHGCKYEHLNN